MPTRSEKFHIANSLLRISTHLLLGLNIDLFTVSQYSSHIYVIGQAPPMSSVVISRPWSQDSSALEFILSSSRDLMHNVSEQDKEPTRNHQHHSHVLARYAESHTRTVVRECCKVDFWTNRDIRFKFGTDIEDGPLLRPDHKTTPKWAWPRSRDQISKFWDPLITLERIDICFKFGTDIDDGPLLRPDHKTTPKWACPGSRDQISKPPNNFWTNRNICLKFGTDIDDGPLLRPDHKMTPKWAWPGSLTEFCTQRTSYLYLPADVTSKVNDMFINKNKTANIKGKN